MEAEIGPCRTNRAGDVGIGGGTEDGRGAAAVKTLSEQHPWQAHPISASVAQVVVRDSAAQVVCPQAVLHASGGGGGGATSWQQRVQSQSEATALRAFISPHDMMV
mmetsp:Transcript_9324/g.29628  ORF Transcript_9324/g.29628 Transcript_9324/m.29628 type:complete len:106 (+) Transcript_9324:1056-1373(+)